MRLILNSQELDEVFPAETTLGAALQAVQQYIDEDEVIADISIDGEPLTAEQLAAWKNRPVDEFSEARIEAANRNALAAKGLRILAEGLQHSKAERENIVDLIGQGQGSQAIKLLGAFLEVWLGVQNTIASAGRLLDVELDQLTLTGDPDSYRVIDYVNQLAEQFSELKIAIEAGDLVLVGDILDYEFGDITERWQDMIEKLADQIESQT